MQHRHVGVNRPGLESQSTPRERSDLAEVTCVYLHLWVVIRKPAPTTPVCFDNYVSDGRGDSFENRCVDNLIIASSLVLFFVCKALGTKGSSCLSPKPPSDLSAISAGPRIP